MRQAAHMNERICEVCEYFSGTSRQKLISGFEVRKFLHVRCTVTDAGWTNTEITKWRDMLLPDPDSCPKLDELTSMNALEEL